MSSLTQMGSFLYSAKAFDVLERLDPDPEAWEGKRGAVVGVFQQVGIYGYMGVYGCMHVYIYGCIDVYMYVGICMCGYGYMDVYVAKCIRMCMYGWM
jgi:hypothetical protein